MESNKNAIQATVQSIDGDRAVLLFPDGQVIRWPVSMLHAGVKAGDKVDLRAGNSAAEPQDGNHNMHELAHELLNKIFGASNG